MIPKHIEHIGIAVRNLEESIKYYEGILGLIIQNAQLVQGADLPEPVCEDPDEISSWPAHWQAIPG